MRVRLRIHPVLFITFMRPISHSSHIPQWLSNIFAHLLSPPVASKAFAIRSAHLSQSVLLPNLTLTHSRIHQVVVIIFAHAFTHSIPMLVNPRLSIAPIGSHPVSFIASTIAVIHSSPIEFHSIERRDHSFIPHVCSSMSAMYFPPTKLDAFPKSNIVHLYSHQLLINASQSTRISSSSKSIFGELIIGGVKLCFLI